MQIRGKKLSVTDIKNKKFSEPIVMITAYDALFARLFEGIADIILVGDSLNMSFNAQKDTLSISMRDMLYHTKAVSKGAENTFIIADMPFGSYFDEKTALKNAIKFYKKAGADAVKLEGGIKTAPIVKRLVDEGINVMPHIGLMPQSVRFDGGYKIKGRNESDAKRLISEAKAHEAAGAFAIVIEGVISSVAEEVAKSVKVPVIGIGSGANIDGQVLVWSDMLGFFDEFKPKFVKRYIDGANLVKAAVSEYANEVRTRKFPSKEFEYKA
ncbi:3-methyl-2-oxobutanoate hydroxymethyltransferase [Campylobacter sp. faydin G-140]|uniref:3-methyl-2-oxobutanoate hydroxymethyltransferase n=1 Tax=Campylobacter anatolicus TaxID=2829105 RepID=UPI001B8E999E|nr:3-methyl-2-oxobutanoate hydroxymethyltransferase [Campylobacter anatolicus]MBR8465711.1 3-methyl-2-oxobutanoate hydroxymethyltransferase [Campylobacter anatolicus]